MFDWNTVQVIDSSVLEGIKGFEEGLRRSLKKMFDGKVPEEDELCVMDDEWLWFDVSRTKKDDGAGGGFAGEWIVFDDGRFMNLEQGVMCHVDGSYEKIEDPWSYT